METKSSFSQLINGDKPVLVDFSAEWCGPCKAMAPVLKELKNIMGEKATIVKVDVDRNQAFASLHEVRSVPTLAIFRNGKVQWRKSGVMSAMELREALEKFS
jgi:thioredoxin 1